MKKNDFNDGPLRVVVQEPSLAKYRLPVFQELARRPGIELFLAYGNRSGLTNETPDGFTGHEFPLWRRKIGKVPIYWHQPQWTFAKRKQTDVLVVNWNVQYLSLVPGLLRARWNKVGTVAWGHGYSKKESIWRFRIRAAVGKMASCALFYNQTTADSYVEKWNWPRERCFVALNSLDQEPIREARKWYHQNSDELIRFQRAHQISPDQTILFVSRLHLDNGTDKLLLALKQLVPEFPRLKVVIVGKGEPEFSRLQQQAQQLGIADRLVMPGAIYGELELAKYFLSSTVFCYPQNIGLSLLHAFGYGLPAVTSDNLSGQNPEIEALNPNENGLFYRDGDVQDLTATLKKILGDPNLRNRLGQGALSTVEERFSITRMVDGLEMAIRFAARQAGRR